MNTNSASPFALGRITAATRSKMFKTISFNSVRNVEPFLKEIDAFGKLDGNFNNLPYSSSSFDDDKYFINHGSDEIAHNFVNRLRHKTFDRSAVEYVNVKGRKQSTNDDL